MATKLGDVPLGSGLVKKAASKIRKRRKKTQNRLDEIMSQMGVKPKKK